VKGRFTGSGHRSEISQSSHRLYSGLLALGITLLCASVGAAPRVIQASYIVSCLLSGIIGAVPAVIVQLFPSKLKVSGISLTYNITYALCSSVLPLFMLGLLHSSRWGIAMLAAAIGALGILTMAMFRNIRMYP